MGFYVTEVSQHLWRSQPVSVVFAGDPMKAVMVVRTDIIMRVDEGHVTVKLRNSV
jgi:hypothetical protein